MENYKQHLDNLRESGNLRQLRDITQQNEMIFFREKEMVNLSSNDYLGLGADKTLWHEFLKTEPFTESGYFPGSACSSRLLTGNHSVYPQLEKTLAGIYQSEAALIFNSGYHANLGILPALTTAKDLILTDKLVHASMIDGIRLSTAKCIRFQHNNLEQLEKILSASRDEYEQVFIVTESIFSMDGDLSDLNKLVEIKERYNALLYIDEAHALGVRGKGGLGLAEETNTLQNIDLLIGTFGKAIASQGAFLICNNILKEYLVNTMRPLIFTTGLPPWSVNWTNFVMEHLSQLKKEREHLSQISLKLRDNLKTMGFESPGESHIVPIIIRDLNKTLQLSEYLCEQGFFVLPIRKPTVPAGTERLRISLTAAVSDGQIEKLSELCKHIGK